MAYSFTEAYPSITRWIEERGWIEVGADEHSTSLVRCLDEGGKVGWYGKVRIPRIASMRRYSPYTRKT